MSQITADAVPADQGASPEAGSDPTVLLRRLFDTAVAAALPAGIIAHHLPEPPKGRTIVLGAGKASASMP